MAGRAPSKRPIPWDRLPGPQATARAVPPPQPAAAQPTRVYPHFVAGSVLVEQGPAPAPLGVFPPGGIAVSASGLPSPLRAAPEQPVPPPPARSPLFPIAYQIAHPVGPPPLSLPPPASSVGAADANPVPGSIPLFPVPAEGANTRTPGSVGTPPGGSPGSPPAGGPPPAAPAADQPTSEGIPLFPVPGAEANPSTPAPAVAQPLVPIQRGRCPRSSPSASSVPSGSNRRWRTLAPRNRSCRCRGLPSRLPAIPRRHRPRSRPRHRFPPSDRR